MNKLLKLRIQLFAEEATDPLETQYLEQIDELKKQMDTMVKGEEYERVLAEHKKLTDEFINRRPVPDKQEVTLEPAGHYAKQLIDNKFKSNKEYIETSLNYRDAYMKETGLDPWGDGGASTEDTKEVANHLRAILEENPDNLSEFNFRLDQSLVDDSTLVTKLRNRK